MVTRQRMATPAIFLFLALVVIAAVVALGVVTWHWSASMDANASAPMAVDWGDKGTCQQVRDGDKCKKPHSEAVDWGDKVCGALEDRGVVPPPCKPGKPPKQVAVDWGNKKPKH